jgi:predicted PolB exonuclease-like 3'-5' exonuclease
LTFRRPSFILERYGTQAVWEEPLPMVNSISADIISRRAAKVAAGAAPSTTPQTAFLVFDTESVPDGHLLGRVKYPGAQLSPEEAIARAQAEAREQSRDGSDFLPVTFQVPIAVCVLRVGADFLPQGLACLGAPHYRTAEIVRQFWRGVAHYNRAKLVTFNGRGFDLPLLELAAFDHGCSARDYFYNSRNRYNGNHIDLFDWLSNYGACRLAGGLNMMAQRAGGGHSPGCGKLDVAGDRVYEMYRAGKLREINDYCMFDTLDTYFVFLRTRVLLGEVSAEEERELARQARAWLGGKAAELPALATYLENWDRAHPL